MRTQDGFNAVWGQLEKPPDHTEVPPSGSLESPGSRGVRMNHSSPGCQACPWFCSVHAADGPFAVCEGRAKKPLATASIRNRTKYIFQRLEWEQPKRRVNMGKTTRMTERAVLCPVIPKPVWEGPQPGLNIQRAKQVHIQGTSGAGRQKGNV